jgi:hypothetical protein
LSHLACDRTCAVTRFFLQCGGDERDDVFLVELLVCFYTEAIPRLRRLLQAVLAYRGGPDAAAYPITSPEPPRSTELIIKDEAHAIKGSAGNLRLWRIAKVGETPPLQHRFRLCSGSRARAAFVASRAHARDSA